MKKLIAVLAVGAVVLSGVAVARSQPSEQAQVEAKIDARLHDLLVKAIERQAEQRAEL